MLRPLGIKVFNLCIQTNPLLSLMEFDLEISLGNMFCQGSFLGEVFFLRVGLILFCVGVWYGVAFCFPVVIRLLFSLMRINHWVCPTATV